MKNEVGVNVHLGSSPRSSTWVDPTGSNKSLSLDDLIAMLPAEIKRLQAGWSSNEAGGTCNPLAIPIQQLLERLEIDEEVWQPFVMVDPSKKYTRNLIATDNETYMLLLLVWNPASSSPIHDHPCNGCWMRVLKGQIQETRYNTTQLRIVQDHLFDETTHGTMFMDNSLGYHKMGNPHASRTAVTLHLYSPPYECCRVWLDESSVDNPSTSQMIMNSHSKTTLQSM